MPARRFIAFQARAGNGHGYLSQPSRPYPAVADQPEVVARLRDASSTSDEPEAPSGAWLDAQADRAFMINQQARLADIAQAQSARPSQTLEQRVVDASRRSRMQHVDFRGEFTALRRMLDAAKTESDRRSERTLAAAARRLEKVEDRLDQYPGQAAA